MNAFWASENFEAFIVFRSSQPRDSAAQDSNQKWSSFPTSDQSEWVKAASTASRLAITIIGGLVLGQILTLHTTPVVYLYLDRFRHWSRRTPRAKR
jgi:hypothetical protein